MAGLEGKCKRHLCLHHGLSARILQAQVTDPSDQIDSARQCDTHKEPKKGSDFVRVGAALRKRQWVEA